MQEKPKKKTFVRYAKSSAFMVSVLLHAVIILLAASFVAVTVINKKDQHFEAKEVKRPRMQLKKLQVPVEINKKKTPKPKLRKRLVVQPKINQKVPEIKMPEITGVKGGLGSAGDGIGGAGSLGFTMPEINIFGLKSSGEKVFLILNCGPSMMVDARGGIPAYTIIKNELLAILEKLPTTTLFNVAVYNKDQTYLLFPEMRSASQGNVRQAKGWLSPLNQFEPGMGNREYGPQTLGRGGIQHTHQIAEPPLVNCRYWMESALLAMYQQADAVYLLTDAWGALHHLEDTYDVDVKWSESDQKKWDDAVASANRRFDEENRQRREKGLPPKVFPNHRKITLVRHYVGDVRQPPKAVGKKKHWYTPEEIEEGMKVVRDNAAADQKMNLARGLRDKNRFSFNVIHFSTREENTPIGQYKKLTSSLRGDYLRLEGLDAIQFKASVPVPEVASVGSAVSSTGSKDVGTPPIAAAPSVEPDANSLLGEWGYGKRRISYEFTSTGTCIQRNRKGEANWTTLYSMLSDTVVQIDHDGGKRFELMGDGSLRTDDGQVLKLL